MKSLGQQYFSQRNGYISEIPEITIREDAPDGLRKFVVQFARSNVVSYKKLREIICNALKELPQENRNWGNDNIKEECDSLLENCKWYKVYDVVEAICNYLYYIGEKYSHDFSAYNQYIHSLNEYMEEKGIGWKIEEGKVIARAPEAIEKTVSFAVMNLENAAKITAKSELHKAYECLSKRPHPDVTGAIQHAVASLECVAREVCNEPNLTLGDLVKKYPLFFPEALKKVGEGIWGFASEKGRHLREGQEPELKDAFLMVGLSASMVTYLLENNSTKNDYIKQLEF